MVHWTGLKPKASAIPVVTVMNFGGPVGKTFDAYWCPDEANALQQVTLSNKANFMFTAKMDGCTFGVGSVTPSKDRLVCHVNLGARGAFGDQGKSQVDLATGPSGPLHGDKSASYLGPAAYRFIDPNANEETQATTFGVRRSNGSWEIWTQVCLFKRSAKVIELVELRQIA